jgi:hypothetical protein
MPHVTLAYRKEPFTGKLNNMKLMNKVFNFIRIILLGAVLNSCGAYSFTGAALPPSITSISVRNFYNDAGSGPSDMVQVFSESLRDYYLKNTNLGVVQEEGDLQLEGSIIGYQLTPVAPTASNDVNTPDRAGLQRLTITVRVDYVNTQDETQSFSKNFSHFADYNPDLTDLISEEPRLINEIFEVIVFDIFSNTVANW